MYGLNNDMIDSVNVSLIPIYTIGDLRNSDWIYY